MGRLVTLLWLATAILWPEHGRADHDRVPNPPRPTGQKLPPLPGLDRTAITVSGLSSGGFFAHQFHVAFSSLVKGAGILAGGPYGCVESIRNPWVHLWTGSPRQSWRAPTTMATVSMACAPQDRRLRTRSGF